VSDKRSALWIDWGRNLRTRTLARRLEVEVLEIRIGGNRLWRYLKSMRRTAAAIRRLRPSLLIATNPSLVLGLLLLVLRRWYGFALVSDAHYVGVRTLSDQRLLQRALDYYNSRVDLVIVTNEPHAQYLASLGARAYVCPDPLPDLSGRLDSRVSVPAKSVFLVCSFERDEPYQAAFDAFSRLEPLGFTLFVSGNYHKAGVDPTRFPWVRFLGYVSEQDYYAYMGSCAVVMDLTVLEECLLCGAYEALAARRPLVISNTRALGNYFAGAAVLTSNTPEGICASVQNAYAGRSELTGLAARWAAQNEVYMEERIATLKHQLRRLDIIAVRRAPGRLAS
jgi:glycosyltransferase involved in cell wall biosynthesis